MANSPQNEEAPKSHARFPETRWSVVVSAQGDDTHARQALNDLCAVYWSPVYAFIRRKGHPPAEAEDLTQGFFASLLERGSLAQVDREKGRLRAFLCTAVTRFMANDHERNMAAKRGGGARVLPLDCGLAEEGFVPDPGHELTPALEFDRQWALRLLQRTMDRLQVQYEEAGRGELFKVLRGTISVQDETAPYATIAGQLGMTEGAVKTAAHRLRRCYRDTLRACIAETVADEADIEEELAQLFSVFQPPDQSRPA